MSGPALARDRTGRRYMIPDPPPDGPPIECPSVTTILNQKAKPALVNWAALEVAKYAATAKDSWINLEEGPAVDLLKRAPYRNMSEKRDIGSAVHIAIDAYLKRGTGQQPQVEDLDLIPYIAGAVRFLDDHVARVIRSEITFVNLTYRYAGTGDAVVKLSTGPVAIVDWKSGKRAYPEAGLQLCAYANNEFCVEADGSRFNLPQIQSGVVVHLDGKGGYTAHPVEFTSQLWRTFIALRTLQKFADTLEDTVLGEPLPFKGGQPNVEELLAKGST